MDLMYVKIGHKIMTLKFTRNISYMICHSCHIIRHVHTIAQL